MKGGSVWFSILPFFHFIASLSLQSWWPFLIWKHSCLEGTIQKCGWVHLHVLPCLPCRGAPLPWPARLWGLVVDQDRLQVHCPLVWLQCSFVGSRHWGQPPFLWLATQWGTSGLWMRRGWWRWSGRMEATVCTHSHGWETTASVHCVPWSRLRPGNCWCLILISTQESTLWRSPMTTR